MSLRSSRLALAGIFVALAALYVVQALLHHSPWIFFDELDYSTTARRIADLGTPPGGKPYYFNGLYPFLIAPAWLADDVHTAYWVSKVIGALVMTTAVFPAYWLARMLAASRSIALFTATVTAAVPALSYSSSLMTETLAYPYAALCFALIVRAITARSSGWIAAMVVACVLAPVVRKELAVIPAAAAVTALAYFGIPRLGRSWRRWAAALVGTVATLAFLAWALTHVSTTWSDALANPRAMISYARSGAASVVVGVAILPAIAAIAALVQPRGARSTRAQKAFACLFVAAAAGFLLYTAAKGVYLGTVANPIEERNLIYLVPLFLAGTAVWLSRRAVEPLALVAATAIVLWLVVTVPLDLSGHPASDAPSLEVLGAIGWSGNALKILLAGIAVLSAAIVLQRSSWVLAGACSLVLAWSLASEIYASRRSADYARVLALSVPRPFEWIDDATQGRSAVYVGQKIRHPTDIWLQSFWNPSLVRMLSLDGTPQTAGTLGSIRGIPASGEFRPVLVRPDGRLPVPPDIAYVVADQGVTGAGPQVAAGERWRIYKGTRLRSAAIGVYADRWMGGESAYTVYAGAPAPGRVRVRLSRKNWCGTDVPGHATISVNGDPRARAVLHACHAVVRSVPVPKPPFDVDVTIDPTFSPASLDPSFSDTRQLGADVTYSDAPPH